MMLREYYYWARMSKDVQDIMKKCTTCRMYKSHLLSQGFYTPLLVLTLPWVDISMDFILG